MKTLGFLRARDIFTTLGLAERTIHRSSKEGLVWIELTDAEYTLLVLKYSPEGTPANHLFASFWGGAFDRLIFRRNSYI